MNKVPKICSLNVLTHLHAFSMILFHVRLWTERASMVGGRIKGMGMLGYCAFLLGK